MLLYQRVMSQLFRTPILFIIKFSQKYKLKTHTHKFSNQKSYSYYICNVKRDNTMIYTRRKKRLLQHMRIKKQIRH